MSTWINMGILGTDYTLRSGHVIFLVLMASSVLLGFNYLNEMYQRIQLQEKMERQTQHIVAERSVIQHKASLLQTQIEDRNKEMKRLQNMHTFQTEQQNSICEEQRNDLLQTISSKDATITEVKTQYESLKQHFEHLQSVMEQFKNNQSRLLEKFSTQSTQCINVINMLSDLCNKGKVNLIRKITQETKQNETSVNRKQSSTSAKATVSTLLVSPPQEFYKTNGKHSTELSSTSPATMDTILDPDHDKQNRVRALQKLQELVSELNRTKSTKDNEDEIIKLEKIQNSNRAMENVFKAQTELNDNETSDEKDLPKNMQIKETLISQKQTTERQTRENEKLSALNVASESRKRNQIDIKKVSNPQYPMLLSKSESLQVTSQNSRTADRDVFTREELTDKPIKNFTEENENSEGKEYSTGKILKVHTKPRRLTLEQAKTSDRDIYKAKGESEYENDTEDMEKGLKLNDQEISEIKL